jgi:hypothetical protein
MTTNPTHIARAAALRLLGGAMAACGALGGGGGGGENLPNRGITPYERVDLGDEGAPVPHVLVPEDRQLTELREPSGLLDDDRVVLFFEVRERASGAGHIVRATSDASGAVFAAATPVLTAADAGDWAGERVGAPSVIRTPEGWLMAFGYGAGEGIGLARSQDGLSFAADPEPALTRDAAELTVDSPSLVRFEGRLLLYYQTVAVEAGAAPHIAYAQVEGAAATRQGIALTPGTGCLGADGAEDPCWDRAGVGSPEVRVARTATGRELLRLFYTGYSAKRGDLGFAASLDGAEWSRFVFNPVVAEKADEREATNLRFGDEYLLYFVEVGTGDAHGIALAIDDAGVPSESF